MVIASAYLYIHILFMWFCLILGIRVDDLKMWFQLIKILLSFVNIDCRTNSQLMVTVPCAALYWV